MRKWNVNRANNQMNFNRYLFLNQRILRNMNQVVKLNGLYYIYNPSVGYYTRVLTFVKYPVNYEQVFRNINYT